MPSTPGSTASTETTPDQSRATASTLTTVTMPRHNNIHSGGIGEPTATVHSTPS
jgi:hypothetical protein